MKFFIDLLQLKRKEKNQKSVQKLAQMLDFFFDFRNLKRPDQSIKLQSIVTEIHNTLLSEEEKKANN
ncbi:hypothetical protein [Bacteroides sp. 51]|uniref:hypothetical protein n=1 Tax=Bacteroides sp. 51 TaxID=2302938 RepID=UPI0013D4499F|nr:hypothetical protein [Bacteroides sp. 51]